MLELELDFVMFLIHPVNYIQFIALPNELQESGKAMLGITYSKPLERKLVS